jgi:hypothetical protein
MPNQCRLNYFPQAHDYDGRFPIYVDQVHADALLLTERSACLYGYNATLSACFARPEFDLTRRAYCTTVDGAPLRETLRNDR